MRLLSKLKLKLLTDWEQIMAAILVVLQLTAILVLLAVAVLVVVAE